MEDTEKLKTELKFAQGQAQDGYRQAREGFTIIKEVADWLSDNKEMFPDSILGEAQDLIDKCDQHLAITRSE